VLLLERILRATDSALHFPFGYFDLRTVHSTVLLLMTKPWPLHAFWPLQDDVPLLQALWPLQAFPPSHFTVPSALAAVTMAPAAKSAAAVATKRFPLFIDFP
jgi:hypothetical protein